MRQLPILCFVVLLSSACHFFENDTKEQYLKDYDAFAADFSSKHALYNTADWQEVSETMNELTNERYYQFEETLTYREKLVLQKWAIMFALTRYKDLVNHQISTEYGNDTETMLNNLREIMDSTYTVYDGFDEQMREILFKIKPCKE